MRRLKAQRGISLIELMVTVTVLMLLALHGAPMMADYLANARLRSAGDAMRAAAAYARHEAVRRNATVRLAIRGSTLEVLDLQSGVPTLLTRHVLPESVVADANVDIDFGSVGRPAVLGANTIGVSMPGVVCSNLYRCPSINVSLAGEINLCGDKTNCI